MSSHGETFRCGHALTTDPGEAVRQLTQQLEGAARGPGILYLSGPLAGETGAVVSGLVELTGITDWVAASGHGVIAGTGEHFDTPAAAAMVLDVGPDDFRLFSGGAETGSALRSGHGEWIERAIMPLALTHVNPRHRMAAAAVQGLADDTGSFLIGGIAADGPLHPGQAEAAVSGVAFSPVGVRVETALSQGCTPLAPAHRITRCEDTVLLELDGRPALDVFLEEIGPELREDLRACAGRIFAALPVPGADDGDYTVRHLVSIDPRNRSVGIAERVAKGDAVLFCRRDQASAVADMYRMTGDLKRRIGDAAVRGGIYVSCAGRGPNQFAAPERETDIITRELGDFPMIGFFANGELSRNQIYGYTGVLTLFL